MNRRSFIGGATLALMPSLGGTVAVAIRTVTIRVTGMT